MARVRITLTITAATALSVAAGGSAGTMADKSIVRDGYGRPIIPGSQLKGKARHAAESLAQTLGLPTPAHFDDNLETPIRRLFGSPEHRSPLRFADLPAQVGNQRLRVLSAAERAQLGPLRPSVALNRRRGTAEDERLLLQETASEGLVFTSPRAITGELDRLTDLALLWAALRLTTRWGGTKSRGLGWATLDAQVFWEDQMAPLADDQLAQALRELAAQKGGG